MEIDEEDREYLESYDGGDKMPFVRLGAVKKDLTEATLVLVTDEFFEEHCVQAPEGRLPPMASAVHRDHDYFDGTDLEDEHVVLVRLSAYEMATEKELEALCDHELAHIVLGHMTFDAERTDEQEMLADALVGVEYQEPMQLLSKKWAAKVYEACPECGSETEMDEMEGIPANYWIYCPSETCDFWVSSSSMNPQYVYWKIRAAKYGEEQVEKELQQLRQQQEQQQQRHQPRQPSSKGTEKMQEDDDEEDMEGEPQFDHKSRRGMEFYAS